MKRTPVMLLSLAIGAVAQGPQDFPKLHQTKIAGAPQLANPQLIMGATGPVVGRQHGLAAPALHDWDADGKRDLWIGEFETGDCWVRVYKNIGADNAPRFNDDFEYATDHKGNRLKIDSW